MEGGGTPYASGMAPSGSYILVIVSQPVTEEHKQIILQRLNKALLSWDVESTGCDLSGLEAVCSNINNKHLIDNDVLIQHSTESLGVEVLVSPTVSTLKQCIKNLFSTSTGHKHLIHAGYTFAGSGSWILQNGTFSFDEFLDIFQQADVQSQKRCNIDVHCAEEGPWNSTNFAKDIFTKVANIALNPAEKVVSVPGSEHLINCLDKVLNYQALEEMMEASPLVGNIRFNRPTLYMFPAGQGDCALFGINGFNMLIDGGFNRRPCSWEFIRHLDRLDAVLVTRLCENNLCGMSTLMKRKALNNTYPQIGYVFCNIAEGKAGSKEDIIAPKDDLVVSVASEGHNFVQTLNELKLKPHQCWRDSSIEPFVLYHKVGHGTLEMHVLSPPRDSKEMKQFLSEWNAYKETFSCIKSGLKDQSLENSIPLSHATSICAVLVWRPADPKDTITRILFPGSAPQNKIFESLEKLKTLDILNKPVVTKASLTAILVAKPISNKIEKSINKAAIPNRKNTASPALSVSSTASRNGDVGGLKRDVKEIKKVTKEIKKDNREVKKEVKKEIKKELVSKEIKKETKTENSMKKDLVAKKEVVKEVKKDVKDIKKVMKKEIKDLKTVIDRKTEVKAPKKEPSPIVAKSVIEVKKTTTAVRKSSTPIKKDAAKPSVAPKVSEVRKSAPANKVSESKTVKDVSNKKTAEAKAVPKSKPKVANSTQKSTPKTKPVAVPKSGGKMTKAVAASSIVASAVAVTVAAVELNEKNEEIVEETEPEIVPENNEIVPENNEIVSEDKDDTKVNEKPAEEINVSPLPPEALSPTPSESISLTPSDTLSSAPLETVSPTPPLANEPISSEEKEVNEIKDIEHDIPYETEIAAEDKSEQLQELEDNDIEEQLAKHQANKDVMSMSFVDEKDFDEAIVEDISSTQAFVVESEAVKVPEISPAEFEKDNQENVEKDLDNEEKENVYKNEDKEMNVDNRLAGLTMEGSFCAGMIESEKEVMDIYSEGKKISDGDNDAEENHLDHHENEFISQHYERSQIDELEIVENTVEMSSSFQAESQNYQLEEQIKNSFGYEGKESEENKETVAEKYNHLDMSEEIKVKQDEKYEHDLSVEIGSSEQHITDLKTQEIYDTSADKEIMVSEELHTEVQDLHDRLSQIKSMEESFHQEEFENFEHPANIIDDVEMQESSVDEPEEIVRKESAVSITLNDEPEGSYADFLRRKSGTESEDDVELQNYIKETKVSADQEKLCIKHGSESDEEDVVKSPTPHAVVDYEGRLDEVVGTTDHDVEDYEIVRDEKESYASEKQDFDEKDHDSAEDQEDSDDGEMIRHPTPPEMKYSEDEMRDPIGQHFIVTPGMNSHGIADEPIYENGHGEESDRSASPVVEVPVFGSAAEADFPELVTVSGDTTPSQPQSPKSNFDPKKFGAEPSGMEALSEHDISEDSVHSPSCHQNTNEFDLPVSDKETIEIDNVQIQDASEHEMITEKSVYQLVDESYAPGISTFHGIEDTSVDSKLDVPYSEKQEVHSEDESASQNDRSEDKSDTHGDKSDHQYDDRSDIHGDDKSDIHGDDESDHQDDRDDASDHHYDGKFDILDDPTGDAADIHSSYALDMPHETERDFKENFEKVDAQDEGISYSVKPSTDEAQFLSGSDNVEDPCGLMGIEETETLHNENIDIQGHSNEELDSKSDLTAEIHKVADTFNKYNIHDFSADVHYNQSVNNSDVHGDLSEAVNDSNLVTGTELSSQNDSNFDSVIGITNEQFSNPMEGDLNVDEENIENLSLGVNRYIELEQKNELVHDTSSNDAELEIDKPVVDLCTYGSSDDENDIDSTVAKIEMEQSVSAIPQEIADNEKCEMSFEHLNKLGQEHIELYEDISPQHAENLSAMENKILSEMTEAHKHEILSQYEENIHTSNEIYSDNSSVKNIVSDENVVEVASFSENVNLDNSHFHVTEEIKSSTTTATTCEYSTVITESTNSVSKFLSGETESETEYYQNPEPVQDVNADNVAEKVYEESDMYSGLHAQYTHVESSVMETYSQNSITRNVTECYYKEAGNEIDSGISQINNPETNDDRSVLNTRYESFDTIVDKDQVVGISSAAVEQVSESFSQNETCIVSSSQKVHEESSYIVTNRFHSDSPEDNAMRTDSSPEAPDPTDLPGHFMDLKNMIPPESHVVSTYIQDKEELANNINFPHESNVPLSPNNHMHGVNRDNPYGESSEEEDSASPPGNMSPYAYTNKAYSREEEDIDGNQIYKEQTTEIIKEVEFDGNNPQTLTTQVNSMMNYTQGYQEMQYSTDANYDFRVEEWGKPMGLPTPPDNPQKTIAKKTEKSGASLSKAMADAKTSLDNGKSYSSVHSKVSSPLKKPKPKATKESSTSPVYVDLAYVPHHGDPQYCDVEFFKKIRARYYVFSSINPSKEVLNALLEAKKSWNEDLDVTIIPTYETDTLGYWMAQNQDDLTEYSIEIAPSASRCTVNLQDHETSCAAYRLEF